MWKKWFLCLALSAPLSAQPGGPLPQMAPQIPARVDAALAFDVRPWTSTSQILDAVEKEAERLRATVVLYEGMSIQLPLPVRILIALTKPHRGIFQEASQLGLTRRGVTSAVLPAGWLALRRGQARPWEAILALKVKDREGVDRFFQTVKMRHGVGPGRPEAKASACRSNLRNMATALEMFSTDHKGKYPAKLAQVRPEYLHHILTCPAGGKYVYQLKTPQGFVIKCAGNHHELGQDCPRYSSDEGDFPASLPVNPVALLIDQRRSGEHTYYVRQEDGLAWGLSGDTVLLASEPDLLAEALDGPKVTGWPEFKQLLSESSSTQSAFLFGRAGAVFPHRGLNVGWLSHDVPRGEVNGFLQLDRLSAALPEGRERDFLPARFGIKESLDVAQLASIVSLPEWDLNLLSQHCGRLAWAANLSFLEPVLFVLPVDDPKWAKEWVEKKVAGKPISWSLVSQPPVLLVALQGNAEQRKQLLSEAVAAPTSHQGPNLAFDEVRFSQEANTRFGRAALDLFSGTWQNLEDPDEFVAMVNAGPWMRLTQLIRSDGTTLMTVEPGGIRLKCTGGAPAALFYPRLVEVLKGQP